jgi:hypothetical protein
MQGTKVFKPCAIPIQPLPVRADEHAAHDFFGYALTGQTNPARAVTKDGLNVEAIRLKFHDICLAVRRFEGS